MTTVTLPRLLAAAGIGILYHWVMVAVWGFLGASNPINDALLDMLMRRENRHVAAYWTLISTHDLLVHLLIALPFAATFRFVPALRNWTYVMLAAAAAFIAVYASTELASLPSLMTSWAFWLGAATVAFSLPVAFMLCNRVFRGARASKAAPNAA